MLKYIHFQMQYTPNNAICTLGIVKMFNNITENKGNYIESKHYI